MHFVDLYDSLKLLFLHIVDVVVVDIAVVVGVSAFVAAVDMNAVEVVDLIRTIKTLLILL